METLLNCQDFPNQFVIACQQRNGYDHAIRASSAHLVEVGFNEVSANASVRQAEAWEYEAALQTLDMDEHLELWKPTRDLIDRRKSEGIPRPRSWNRI